MKEFVIRMFGESITERMNELGLSSGISLFVMLSLVLLAF